MSEKIYEEKFIVINKKHLETIPKQLKENLAMSLAMLSGYIPDNKYYVCNQDEPYAQQVIDIILGHEPEQETVEQSGVKVFNTHCQHCSEPLTVNFKVACPNCGKHPGYQNVNSTPANGKEE